MICCVFFELIFSKNHIAKFCKATMCKSQSNCGRKNYPVKFSLNNFVPATCYGIPT